MGCIYSTEAPATRKKKKAAVDDSSKGKAGKKAQTTAKRDNARAPSAPQVAPKKAVVAAPQKHRGAGPAAAVSDQRPSAKATNPLDFTTNGTTQVAGSQRDRLSSISTTESARDVLLTAHPSTADAKATAVLDHIPLSEGKLKNLRVWIDATDKVQLLDPQDTVGQQRRERERAAGAPTQQAQLVVRKRASILNSFTDITGSPSECEPNGSVRALRDDNASTMSSNV